MELYPAFLKLALTKLKDECWEKLFLILLAIVMSDRKTNYVSETIRSLHYKRIFKVVLIS